MNVKNQRLETVESLSGIVVHEYEVRADSGGPGAWRGGVGQMITFEARHGGGTLIIQGIDRQRFQGWGVFGARPVAPFRVIRNRSMRRRPSCRGSTGSSSRRASGLP